MMLFETITAVYCVTVARRVTCLSRLDYGNSTLVGILVHLLRRLQSVLNAAARLPSTIVRFRL